MLLSVVVVNWNSVDDLRDCLLSLRSQSYHDLEVIVIDNGSSDGSADMVRDSFPEFRVLAQNENLGFAEGCNRGIEAANGEWVAMLNNDAIAEPTWAEALADAAATSGPDCGMLQSLLLYQGRANTINSAGIELAYSGGGRDRKEGARYDSRSESETETIFCPTAGAAAYRRAMLDAVRLPAGYFDSAHFLYYEDMDLGWRARLGGWSARYVPRSIVHHKWHGSSDRHGKRHLQVLANTNRIRTLLKNASPGFIVATLPRTLKELAEIVWYGRVKGVVKLLLAIVVSVRDRRRVLSMLSVPRRRVEDEFRARPRRG